MQLSGYVSLIELMSMDQYGSLSPESMDGFRMMYVQPELAAQDATVEKNNVTVTY